MKKGIAVVVTTEFRGVFFGKLAGDTTKIPDEIKINDARNCIYWDESVKGFLGLAANGPSERCRIGPPVPSMLINKITSIAECSEKAIKAWESEPWS